MKCQGLFSLKKKKKKKKLPSAAVVIGALRVKFYCICILHIMHIHVIKYKAHNVRSYFKTEKKNMYKMI